MKIQVGPLKFHGDSDRRKKNFFFCVYNSLVLVGACGSAAGAGRVKE
jgi:hypothetical protein